MKRAGFPFPQGKGKPETQAVQQIQKNENFLKKAVDKFGKLGYYITRRREKRRQRMGA